MSDFNYHQERTKVEVKRRRAREQLPRMFEIFVMANIRMATMEEINELRAYTNECYPHLPDELFQDKRYERWAALNRPLLLLTAKVGKKYG